MPAFPEGMLLSPWLLFLVLTSVLDPLLHFIVKQAAWSTVLVAAAAVKSMLAGCSASWYQDS